MSNWKLVSLVRKGLAHSADGAECQDCVKVVETDSLLVAALADGLGSLPYSELAARTATQAICDYFTRIRPDPLPDAAPSPEELLSYMRTAIEALAEERSLSLSDMDCTLSFVCISKPDNRAVIGLLGDSAVCVMGSEQSIVMNHGNATASGTYAVLDKDASEHLLIRSVDLDAYGILGFILSSDGLENELYVKGSSRIKKIAASYFNTLMEPDGAERAIRERLDKITADPRSPFDDDISLVILSRAEEKIELPSDPTWLCSCGERNPLQNTYCQACHTDFTALYGKYRFREYGGKAAFFEKINASPEEERKIVGPGRGASAASDRPGAADAPQEPPQGGGTAGKIPGQQPSGGGPGQGGAARPSGPAPLQKKAAPQATSPTGNGAGRPAGGELAIFPVGNGRTLRSLLPMVVGLLLVLCVVIFAVGRASEKKHAGEDEPQASQQPETYEEQIDQPEPETYEEQIDQPEPETYEEQIDQLEDRVSSLEEQVSKPTPQVPVRVLRSPTPETRPVGFVSEDGYWLFSFAIEGSALSFTWEKQLDSGNWAPLIFDRHGVDAKFGLRLDEDLSGGTSKLVAAGLTEESAGVYKCTVKTDHGYETVQVSLTVEPAAEVSAASASPETPPMILETQEEDFPGSIPADGESRAEDSSDDAHGGQAPGRGPGIPRPTPRVGIRTERSELPLT